MKIDLMKITKEILYGKDIPEEKEVEEKVIDEAQEAKDELEVKVDEDAGKKNEEGSDRSSKES